MPPAWNCVGRESRHPARPMPIYGCKPATRSAWSDVNGEGQATNKLKVLGRRRVAPYAGGDPSVEGAVGYLQASTTYSAGPGTFHRPRPVLSSAVA